MRRAPAEETLEQPPISIRPLLKFNFIFLETLALAIRRTSKLQEYCADSQGERSQGLFEHWCWSFDKALGVRHCGWGKSSDIVALLCTRLHRAVNTCMMEKRSFSVVLFDDLWARAYFLADFGHLLSHNTADLNCNERGCVTANGEDLQRWHASRLYWSRVLVNPWRKFSLFH